jgi:RNA polymerase sigma-32 factor
MRPLIRYGSFALSVCHFRRPKRTVRVRLDSHLSWQASEVSKVSMINRGEGILAGGSHNSAFEDSRLRYLQAIYKFPLISQEEEIALARQWRDRQDMAAMQKLVTSHLRLVAKVARGYSGYGLPMDDLISEGGVGMLKAVHRFDPERGVRLATYAVCWIRATINEYILRNWSLVRVSTTARQKKLFFNLRRLKNQMHVIDEGDLKPEQVSRVARTLDVPESDVIHMSRRLSARDHSLNAPVGSGNDSERQDGLIDEAEGHDSAFAEREELRVRKALLPGMLGSLNARERRIVAARHLKEKPSTFDELAQQYGISRQRVRQIEIGAMKKMQRKAQQAPAPQ